MNFNMFISSYTTSDVKNEVMLKGVEFAFVYILQSRSFTPLLGLGINSSESEIWSWSWFMSFEFQINLFGKEVWCYLRRCLQITQHYMKDFIIFFISFYIEVILLSARVARTFYDKVKLLWDIGRCKNHKQFSHKSEAFKFHLNVSEASIATFNDSEDLKAHIN